MREKTNKQTNQVESFWREIGNWFRSIFILDLSALKKRKKIYYNIKQQCWNEKENRKDEISCLPLQTMR